MIKQFRPPTWSHLEVRTYVPGSRYLHAFLCFTPLMQSTNVGNPNLLPDCPTLSLTIVYIIALKDTGIPLTTLFRDRTNVKPSGRLLSPLIVQSGRRCLCLPVCADSRGPFLIFFLDAPVRDVVKPDQYESPGYMNNRRGYLCCPC